MKYATEYRDKDLISVLARELRQRVTRPMRIMEVCGTHTMAIFSHGLRKLFPERLQLISGPGCPVCVTPGNQIDDFVDIARQPRVGVAVFGDLLRVPGARGSLGEVRAEGARVEVVYSVMDALALARQEPAWLWVFPAVGFETTAPTIAAVVLEAARMQLDNFCIYPANKIMPPALRTLFAEDRTKLDGLLCPGHVTTIIGLEPYRFLAEKHGVACAVAGFEPADIFQGLLELAEMIARDEPGVVNSYPRAVRPEGNERARELIERVFQPVDSAWRGLGVIGGSGLGLRPEYAGFDACTRLGITTGSAIEPAGCRCGEILQGKCVPPDCPLFGRRCTPAQPVGPCMVSSEGTCAAYYRYGLVAK